MLFRIILAHFIFAPFHGFYWIQLEGNYQTDSQSQGKILTLFSTFRVEKRSLLDVFQIISSALISIYPQLTGVEPWLFVPQLGFRCGCLLNDVLNNSLLRSGVNESVVYEYCLLNILRNAHSWKSIIEEQK